MRVWSMSLMDMFSKRMGACERSRRSTQDLRAIEELKACSKQSKNLAAHRLFRITRLEASPPKFFAHSGFASKDKGPQIVRQNVIGESKIQSTKKTERPDLTQLTLQEIKESFYQRFYSRQKKSPESLFKERNAAKVQPCAVTTTGFSFDTSTQNEAHSDQIICSSEEKEFTNPSELQLKKFLNKAEIRKSIYPNLNEEFLGEKTNWVNCSECFSYLVT